jgi:hypothetical protein
MVESLAEEVWILKDRQLILEQLLIDRGHMTLAEIETYEPTQELMDRLAKDRQRLIRKVFTPVLDR